MIDAVGNVNLKKKVLQDDFVVLVADVIALHALRQRCTLLRSEEDAGRKSVHSDECVSASRLCIL
jgi:hypothetical protein